MISKFKLETNQWFLLAAVVSLLISAWLNFGETVINTDGICYLTSAKVMGLDGIKAGASVCPQARWPLYPSMIFFLTKFSPFSYIVSAYIINAVFSIISVLMFLAIIVELGATPRVIGFAALTILLSHDFNAVRQYIVRDHGFWAFYLSSIFCLLLYFRVPNWRMALAWSGSIMLATLFRIEGGVFLVLCPFLAFLHHQSTLASRFKHFCQLNALTIASVIAAGIWLGLNPHATVEKLGRFNELAMQFSNGFMMVVNRFYEMSAAISTYVLPVEARRDASLLLVLTYVVWYLCNVIKNLSMVAALLVLYSWVSQAALWTRPSRLVVLGYLAVNFIITAGFFAEHQFLSKRYIMAMSLVLLLWVPYALDKLWQKSNKKPYANIFRAIMLLIMVSALGGIFNFGYSKKYIHDAGDWLSDNMKTSQHVFVNDLQVMYYSKLFENEIFVKEQEFKTKKGAPKGYDYLALRLDSQTRPVVQKQLGVNPVKVFKNKREDQVAIFDVRGTK